MRDKLNKICWMLAIVFTLNVMTEGYVVTQVEAATMTAAEKAKAQKAKERAKAQAQREKEKAKKAKEKAKAQAQAQKAKEKAAQAREKERAQAAADRDKATTRQSATSTSESRPSASDQQTAKGMAYLEKVAAVQKYNAHVAAYMSRDISHRLGVWGQIGYSSIFPGGFEYDATSNKGFNAASKGWVGGGAGFGYQLRYKSFLFTTGAEFEMYNSQTSIYGDDKKNPLVSRTFGMKPYEDDMTYTYNFADMTDMWRAGYVQLPLLFGAEFAQKQAYFMVGPKVGINVIGSSAVKSSLTTEINDKMAIDAYQDIYSHALVSDYAFEGDKQKLKFGLNLAVAAEIGLNLDRYMQPKPAKGKKLTAGQELLKKMHTYVALFAEYGVLNVQPQLAKMYATYPECDMPANLYKIVSNGLHPVDALEAVPALETSGCSSYKANPFLVGAKLTVMFDLPRKKLKPMNMPSAPLPPMTIRVVNDETNKGVPGAELKIDGPKDKHYVKTTNSSGFSRGTYQKGDYILSATKMGYFPSDTITYTLEQNSTDTVIIALRPEPIPIVYTLCGYVRGSETNAPLEADMRISSLTDTTTLYAGTSADDGLFVTDLLSGDYIVHARSTGYMPLDDTVHFEQDTLSFTMQKIKEGIKVKIENLFFATNRTNILPESEEAMSGLAQFLLDNESVTIHIMGHTDAVGSEKANLILSEGRANSVRLELIKRGIDADRITAEGKGESEPVADNETEEGRALNRRVEFTITGTGGKDVKQVY